MITPVFVYDAIRSPRGKARADGALHTLSAQQLLAVLYDALVERTGLNPEAVAEVILGCVTQHGEQAANIAKTSALYARWPASVSGLTVNRFCSSSLDAVGIAALKIAAGQAQAVVAGGVEMMSRQPMLVDKPPVFTDPAFARECQMYLMGSGADLIASRYVVSRSEADAVALQSQQRAHAARAQGFFKSIIPVYVPATDSTVSEDECIRPQTTAESLAAMPPAFAELGASGVDAVQLAAHPDLSEITHIHTAGNSPAMADGASLVLLGDERLGDQLGVAPRARILATVSASDDPMQVLSGCVAATRKLLDQQELPVTAIDLFEIHEAFAATMVKCQRELAIDDSKLNVNGGVIALGHPMGATGAMMLGTLIDELERRELSLGVVAASGAAGAGSAVLVERLAS